MISSWYRISIGGNVKVADVASAMQVAGEMVAANGGGVPDIKPCDEQGNLLSSPVEEEVVTKIAPDVVKTPATPVSADYLEKSPPPVYSDFGAGRQIVDANAASRLSNLYDKLEGSGITGLEREKTAMGYVPGTRMAQIGYDTQAKRKLEHEAKMPVREAIDALNAVVESEQRREVEVSSRELIDAISDKGPLTVQGMRLTEHAIKGLYTRLNANNDGFKASGLARIFELRERIKAAQAANEKNRVNRISDGIAHYAQVEAMISADRAEVSHCLRHELSRFPDVKLKLRTRENPALNDIFAVVSPSYTVADAPMITPEFLKSGVPDDARGNYSYDPETTKWSIEIATWTPTDTINQVVGEPTSGFLNFSGSDDGTGRISGDGGIMMIQCLNASLYSAGGVEVSRVHRGKVIFDVQRMLKVALHSINTLSQAWGNNRKIVVETPTGLTLEQAIPGLFRDMLNRGELVGVLTGRKENHIQGLTRAYKSERRDQSQLVRADLAQSWTRYVQDQPSDVRLEAERSIGNWLVSPTKLRVDLKD